MLPDCACVFASRNTVEPESTQHKQSGKTPEEEVKLNHFTVDVSGYNEPVPTEELSPSNSRLSGPTKYRLGQKYVYSNYSFFFTVIVNDGRELKYRTKKVDFEAVMEN